MSAHPYDEQPTDPTWTPEAAHEAAQFVAGRLTFGIDRLPDKEQTCPAWPTLGQVEGARNAAFTRFVKGALKDKGIGEMLAGGRAKLTYR